MPVPLDTPNTYPNFTNHGLGQGILDQLMIAVESHVEKQYDDGRIDSATYGQVYLGALEAAMTQATQYLLGHLLNDEKKRQLDLGNQKAEFEIEFMLPKQLEMISKQIDKLTAEISLLGKQEDKIDKEIEFMTYKIMTERANTEAGIAEPGSLVGKQITLLFAQHIGFAGDIATKVGKLFADYDGIFETTQEDGNPTLSIDNTQVKLAVAEELSERIAALDESDNFVPDP